MITGKEKQVSRTVAATVAGDGAARGIAGPGKPRAVPETPRNVMDLLLGEDNLTSSFDAGGNDPYNATGRQFRR
jgi:hypothetical protein